MIVKSLNNFIKMIANIFCFHDWKLIEPSDINNIKPYNMIIYQCTKCKKLKFSSLDAEKYNS